MQEKETEVFYPASPAAWRKWLAENHRSKSSVWLVFYTKSSGRPSITWSDAVDAALCYGWIDSKKIKIDKERAHQYFSRRKAKSNWSRINKEKVEKLMAAGLMTEAGFQSIAIAQQNGSWTILDEVEDLKIPTDLEEAFATKPGSQQFFQSLSKSAQKATLQWLVLARRPETRQKRIAEITEKASQKKKLQQF